MLEAVIDVFKSFREPILVKTCHASVTGSNLNTSAVKRSRGEQEIAPCEVKMEHWGVLGEIVA